jgi:hypothetical protein
MESLDCLLDTDGMKLVYLVPANENASATCAVTQKQAKAVRWILLPVGISDVLIIATE